MRRSSNYYSDFRDEGTTGAINSRMDYIYHINYLPRWIRVLAVVLLLAGVVSMAQASLNAPLAWNSNPEANIAGYRMYYGTASGRYSQMFDVGNTTTATVSSLTPGTTYFFVVTAYDTSGVESAASAEVSFTATDASSAMSPGSINSLQWLANGSVQLNLTVASPASPAPAGVGTPSAGVDVQFTDDLLTWSVLTTISNTAGTFTVTDPKATGVPRRFYRLVFH